MTSSQPLVIEIIGDGKADAGPLDETPQPPKKGIVAVLAFKICGFPPTMHTRRRKPLFLQNGTKLWRRVQQSKMRAVDSGDAGLIYLVDTEGEKPQKLPAELAKGRDTKHAAFAMAVGVAHPCIEAWLLADAASIHVAFGLAESPLLADNPEALTGAPNTAPGSFYKRTFAQAAGVDRADLSVIEKSALARTIQDFPTLRSKCPSFDALAAEIEQRIKPIFMQSGAAPHAS